MKAEYKAVHQEADRLQHRFSGVADNPGHPVMRTLQQQMRDVMEAIESDKAPRAIDDRVKNVQNLLRQAGDHDEALMSPSDADALRSDYEDLRASLRKLPNY